jgi:threonine dehydratase
VVFPEMFALARTLLDGSLVVDPDAAADAVRLLATRAHVVAEGAGAVPVAAALAGLAGAGTVVAIVSGGGIDTSELADILSSAT